MKVKITQDDIDNGIAWDCHHCPLANAINRARGFIRRFFLGPAVIQTYRYKLCLLGKWRVLPDRAMAWTNDFDHGMKVNPTELEI
jgi:hypothetical protein